MRPFSFFFPLDAERDRWLRAASDGLDKALARTPSRQQLASVKVINHIPAEVRKAARLPGERRGETEVSFPRGKV